MIDQDTSRKIDLTVATLLVIISALGFLLNLLSFLYFKNKKPRNGTSNFFRRVYLAITLTDTLICLVLFPVIDAAYSPRRAGRLFHSTFFCEVWTVIWWILPQTSVLLVGLLSVSRLVVLWRPGARLPGWLPYALPGGFVVSIVVVYVGGVLVGAMFPQYVSEWMYCAVLPVPLEGKARLVSELEWNSGVFLFTVASLAPALSLVLISASFVTSLIVLRKQTANALNLGGSIKKHKEATKTVFIITFLYIIFNIPSTVVLLGIIGKIAATLNFRHIYIEEYIRQFIRSSGKDTTLSNYIFVLVSTLPISLNSLINPAVYFGRMGAFGRYFKRHFRSYFGQMREGARWSNTRSSLVARNLNSTVLKGIAIESPEPVSRTIIEE